VVLLVNVLVVLLLHATVMVSARQRLVNVLVMIVTQVPLAMHVHMVILVLEQPAQRVLESKCHRLVGKPSLQYAPTMDSVTLRMEHVLVKQDGKVQHAMLVRVDFGVQSVGVAHGQKEHLVHAVATAHVTAMVLSVVREYARVQTTTLWEVHAVRAVQVGTGQLAKNAQKISTA
jgi:hypothetical protein|tara:strand:+ start:422 stop:943 length:522 start_codon:yes stop_codon:yes gene_type:complete